MNKKDLSAEDIEALYQKLDSEAEASGYHLNPDLDFTKNLVRGLIINERRYGYWSCPCRLASGIKEKDLDIICPCDYRDPDLDEYGQCYCALYVSGDVKNKKKNTASIPERRYLQAKAAYVEDYLLGKDNLRPAYPVWRCKVCGYLCAREGPPEVCPVCKAKKDRFEKFKQVIT